MKRLYTSYTTPNLYKLDDGLDYWREKLLLSFIFFLSIAVFLAYVPSFYLSLEEGLIAIAIIDTLFYSGLLALLFLRKVSVFSRSICIALMSYCLGVFLLVEVGPFGAGYLWLFIVPIIASVLINFKYAILTVILNVITLIVLGFLQYYNVIANGYEYGFYIGSWIVISANFIFLNIVAVGSIQLIVNGIERSYKKQIIVSDRLEEQKKELIEAKETAENSLKMKSEFLAQVSHEIRTPINTILSFISLIKNDLYGKHSYEVDESFGMIENGSKRIIRTIDLIINMSEIQTNSLELNKQKFNLVETILLPLYNEFNQIAKNKGLNFNCENNMEQDAEIYADSYTITQMFANLIDNAIKYTKAGTITLICRLNDTGNVIVDIEDSGIGISEDAIKEVFKPFTQEESGYTRKYEGIGLGLSLVKSYCDLNDIKLFVESKKNVGTTFSVEFNQFK